ncbi:unnamed protein product [Adineta steineri]|uniref:DUF1772-domain-containing protein n=1 Tax=Adineta steineri TaxID=433720 RepID=A0A814NFC5_9BILA|nr:unnamed protein product [Adineta steineri]CAF1092817.1 unnamed protein product [Adineta steineri]
MSITSTSILNHFDTIAVVTGGLFAGTALYLSIGQVPAMREFGLNEHWRFFPYMYKKIALTQASLAAIAGTTSIVHATRIHGAPFFRYLWIAAGTTFLAIIPYTIICLAPTNQTIIDDNKNVKLGNESHINFAKKKELLDKWAFLHFVRTVSSVAGFGMMVYGLSRHSSFVFTW